MRRKCSGFSLVELSIVLVILGLLVGGILAGQSLIRAAELRSVSVQFNNHATALQSFRDKYFAIPGDMNNATRFWGRHSLDAWCVTNSSAAVDTATGTCDGNGGGTIGGAAAASQSGERNQFWRHLALAGLVEGNYSGLAGPASTSHQIPGVNIPASKISQGGWAVLTLPNYAGDANLYALDYGNFMQVGASTVDSTPSWPLLRPEEAWNLDTKMDDGKPASGKVVAMYWNNLCAAADDGTHAFNDYVASYKLSDTAIRCSLIFRHSF